MADQEIGIKLKADASGAIKSVKDLEKNIKGLDDLKSKGEQQHGFLGEKDVAKFRKLSTDAAGVYKNFFRELSQVQRDIARKKLEIERLTAQGLTPSSPQLKGTTQQLQLLQANQRLMRNNVGNMYQLRGSGNQTSQQIGRMHTGSMMLSALNNGAGRLAGGLGLFAMGHKAYQWMDRGSDLVKQYEKQVFPLAQQVGGYNGDSRQARLDALNTGRPNGFTAGETISTARTFTNLAGASTPQEMWANTDELQKQSRAMGMDVNQLAGVEGTLAQKGALSGKAQMRQWAEIITGAVDKTKMAGRQQEMTTAFTNLVSGNANGQVNFSNKQAMNLLGYQTMLGQTGLPGFKGQAGADFLGNVDSSIKNGGSDMQLLLGVGRDRPATYKEKLKMQRQQEQGVTPENMTAIAKTADFLMKNGGGDQETNMMQASSYVAQKTGTTSIQWDAILQNPKLMEQLMSGQGGMDELVKQISGPGADQFKKQLQDAQNSRVMARDKVNAGKEASQQYFGQPWDAFKTSVGGAFFNQHPLMQGLEWGGAAALGGMGLRGLQKVAPRFLGKAINGGGGMFSKATDFMKNIFGKGTPTPGGGVGANPPMSQWSKTGDFFKNIGSKLGGGAGAKLGLARLLPPVAAAVGFHETGAMGSKLADWAFGHKKGDSYHEGVFDSNHSYEDNRDPIWKRIFKNTQDEKKNLQERKAIAQQESVITSDQQRKLKGDVATVPGASSSGGANGVGGTGFWARLVDVFKAWLGVGNGGKGFWDNLLDKIKSLFGFGGQSGGGSGGDNRSLFGKMKDGVSSFINGNGFMNGYSGNYASDIKGSGANSDYLNMSLKNNAGLSADQVNQWIDRYAKPGSQMRGQGSAFLQAAQETGLDVRYLVGHAAQETGWGSSEMVNGKYNYFGIGAFDSNPDNAASFNSPQGGIVEGAKWIKKNYTDAGQDTLAKMTDPRHIYATDPNWDDNIASIMANAPSGGSGGSGGGFGTFRVIVSGGVDGLTPENNNAVTSAIEKHFTMNRDQLGYEFRQGIGGDR